MLKTSKYHHLPYRKNVSCIVFKNNKFLLVQLHGWPDNFWKFPQGGISTNELEKTAARRELIEELGTDKFKFIRKSIYKNKYDWTDDAVKLAGKRWRGQIQKFFLVEYLGDNKDIKINKNEVSRYKWVGIDNLYSHIDHDDNNFRNYKQTIDKILQEFKRYFK